MSYNNFSYYNGPSSNPEWWGPKKAVIASGRNVAADVNKQPLKAITPQGYAQSMILPCDSRPMEPIQPRVESLQGTVTQLFSNFGYINDNIIFSKCDVVGPMVLIGDKVAVDATYQPNNPTKYKGERVSKIDESRFSSVPSSNFGKMNTLAQGITQRTVFPERDRVDKYNNARWKGSLKNRLKFDPMYRSAGDSSSHDRTSESIKTRRGNIKDRLIVDRTQPKTIDIGFEEKKATKRAELLRKAEDRKRKFYESKNMDETPKPKDKSPLKMIKVTKEVSPLKRKSESRGKYVVKSQECFGNRELDCAAVRILCKTLPLPEKFFHASLKYQHSFPLNHPMKLGNNCHFKIMDKKVKSIDKFIDSQLHKVVDPEDADTTFVAKVMLLSTDDLAKLYKDTLTVAEEFDGDNKIPITKAIKFLVCGLGKDKEFAIGGAWSPSLDGPDPESNPKVLINTAIRTCKAITGIDLSNCSSWPKFLELRYYRPLQKVLKTNVANNAGEVVIDLEATEEPVEYREPRMETVIYYIPDVWNCMPSQDSWNEITRLYQEQLACILCPPPVLISSQAAATRPDNSSTSVSVSSTIDAKRASSGEENKSTNEDQEEEDYSFNEVEEIDDKSKNSDVSDLADQPTHYSKLVVTGMKIVDIKKELELRKLNNRGVMEQLKARLKAALEKEENEDKNKDTTSTAKTDTVMRAEPEITLSEEQKNELKKLYKMPDRPEIIVHQNCKIFSRQLKLRTMSLHTLLSYYNVKLDESTFELALFGKQFLDMLRRDAVFNIYKSIVVAKEGDLVNVDECAKKPKLMITTSKRTTNRTLLFSCTLLDREKTNRMSIEDLKSLVEGLGICLSSSQLSVVLDKVMDSSKSLNYRQLTDKVITESDMASMLKLDASEDLDYIKELAMGNKALFDVDNPQTNFSMNEDDLERLKNELDRSERCRQSVELKISEIKDETERNILLARTQAKEIARLKEQMDVYKSRLSEEQDRASRYRRDLDKMTRQFKDVSGMTAALNDFVHGVVVDKSKAEPKKTDSWTEADKVAVTENIVFDLTEDCVEKVAGDIDMTEASILDVNVTVDMRSEESADQGVLPDRSSETIPVASSAVEDFESSKPSDYDMILLDETE